MSQRNPMNDRYTAEERAGQTRKSAASAKPKTKAAASVRMQPTVKTKQQKKAEQKAQRAKQSELDRKYYNPPTAEYKRLRKIYWCCLGGAILCTVLSFVGQTWLAPTASYVTLGLAYVFIIAAFYIDFSKIRKVRRAYQAEMMAKKTKEMRAAEKQQKASERQAAAAKQAEAASPASEAPQKRGLLGGKFRLPKLGAGKDKADTAQATDGDGATGTSGNGESAKAQGAAAADSGTSNSVFQRGKATAQAAADSASKTAAAVGADANEGDKKGK